MAAARERRRGPRRRDSPNTLLRIAPVAWPDRSDAATLVDASDSGLGVKTEACHPVGAILLVQGEAGVNGQRQPVEARGQVVWSLMREDGLYYTGVSFEALGVRNPFLKPAEARPPEPAVNHDVDHYEVLQLSPNADTDTIHRVYRLLAQRYHPDNRESGNEEAFKRVLRAYRLLSDPEQRAAYDVSHSLTRQLRWKIFDQVNASTGMEAEKRKRSGILALLYTKRMHQPDQPGMTAAEMEDLLGCPREHLEFGLWFLRDSALVARTDSGRYAITVKGVNEAESIGAWTPCVDRLLPEPTVT